MGSLLFFEENVTLDDNSRVGCVPHQVQVLDNHGVPEIVIGPVDVAYRGERATFNDWEQFERFVDAVNTLKFRLQPE